MSKEINELTWNAIISLLSVKYPEITKEQLEKMLEQDAHADMQYVGTKEARTMLACSTMSLYRWEKRGMIRVRRLSRRKVLYNVEDIKKLLRG